MDIFLFLPHTYFHSQVRISRKKFELFFPPWEGERRNGERVWGRAARAPGPASECRTKSVVAAGGCGRQTAACTRRARRRTRDRRGKRRRYPDASQFALRFVFNRAAGDEMRSLDLDNETPAQADEREQFAMNSHAFWTDGQVMRGEPLKFGMWPNIMTQDEDILVKTQDEDILAHVCYECMDKQRQLCEQDSPEGKKQDTSVANPAPSKKAPTATSDASASSSRASTLRCYIPPFFVCHHEENKSMSIPCNSLNQCQLWRPDTHIDTRLADQGAEAVSVTFAGCDNQMRSDLVEVLPCHRLFVLG